MKFYFPFSTIIIIIFFFHFFFIEILFKLYRVFEISKWRISKFLKFYFPFSTIIIIIFFFKFCLNCTVLCFWNFGWAEESQNFSNYYIYFSNYYYIIIIIFFFLNSVQIVPCSISEISSEMKNLEISVKRERMYACTGRLS